MPGYEEGAGGGVKASELKGYSPRRNWRKETKTLSLTNWTGWRAS